MRVAPAALLKQRPSEEVWAFLAISSLYSVMLVTLLVDYIRGAVG